MRIPAVLTTRRVLLAAGLLAILAGSLVGSAALLQVESATLATFSLTVVPPPPPPADFEGCSPGFWKQPHHFGNWPAGFSPDDLVSSAFGSGAPPDLTLLEALGQGGGGVNALLRQAVAALLNAAHVEVNYPIALADVILLTQAALQPGGDVEGTKDTFQAANELGCGLSDGDDGEDDDGGECEDDEGDECNGDEAEDCEDDEGVECEDGSGGECEDDEGEECEEGVEECQGDDQNECAAEDEESSDSEDGEDSDLGPDQTPESGDGCAADYWKDEENLAGWPEGLSPDALVSEIFGVEIPDSPTLFEALSNEGDGVEALIRQATAALLNALSPEIEFGKNAEEIIELFQIAFGSDDPVRIAETTHQLEELNDGVCPWPSGSEDQDLNQSDSETLDPTPTAEPDHPAPTDSPEPTPTPEE